MKDTSFLGLLSICAECHFDEAAIDDNGVVQTTICAKCGSSTRIMVEAARPPAAAIRRIVDRFWNGETHHFQTCSPEEKERHIWHALAEVNEWLAAIKDAGA